VKLTTTAIKTLTLPPDVKDKTFTAVELVAEWQHVEQPQAAASRGQCPWHKPAYLGIVFSRSFHPKVRTMKTLVAVAIILAMVLVPPALAKAKRAQSAPQQGYQSSERPAYYHGYPLSLWYRDALSSY